MTENERILEAKLRELRRRERRELEDGIYSWQTKVRIQNLTARLRESQDPATSETAPGQGEG